MTTTAQYRIGTTLVLVVAASGALIAAVLEGVPQIVAIAIDMLFLTVGCAFLGAAMRRPRAEEK